MILSRNGLATFIIHPDYILERETQRIYSELLRMLNREREKECLWCALPGEIDIWWRQRAQMSIVESNGSWKIIGDATGRAKLAFARLANGQLTFEIADANRAVRPEMMSD